MMHIALLAAVLASPALAAPDPAIPAPTTMIRNCFAVMDGAVYHGDPSDRTTMKVNVTACEKSIAQINQLRPTIAQGPEKLYLTGRLLDRAATLRFMGLGDAGAALAQVKLANLYFRIAAGLPNQSENYRAAAAANVALTTVQLQTLRKEPATSSATALVTRKRGLKAERAATVDATADVVTTNYSHRPQR